MYFCCIDPGIRNFALSIEKFDNQKLKNLSFTGKKNYRDRSLTPEYSDFLYKNVFTNGELIYNALVDISPDVGHSTTNINESRIKLTRFLNSIAKYLDLCDGFFCERQLRVNRSAQKIEDHCYSYFTFMYGNNRIISDVSPVDKYRVLGCENRLKKYIRKKWATKICLSILDARGDNKTIIELTKKVRGKKKKLDDISDTVLICQALKIQIFLNK